MKLVISPAKSLDYKTEVPTTIATQASFLKQAEQLNTVLKEKSPKELSALMKISSNLSELNYERNQDWQLPLLENKSRQAIYAFNGGVYKGLDVYSLPEHKIETMQNTICILSGLYGLLKPTDLIMPYRLEMGTKLPVGSHKNLYEFWKETIVTALNQTLKDDEVFLNLASNEYFKAINTKALKVPVVTANFKDLKNGTYKIISFYAKEARGLMARYVIDTEAKTIDDLKGFNYEGYAFSAPMSKDNDLVFIR